MANAGLDGSSASTAASQIRYGGSKRRIRCDSHSAWEDNEDMSRSKVSRQDDSPEAFDLEGFSAVPSESLLPRTTTGRYGGYKRSRSPLDTPSPSELDSPSLEPATPARRESSVPSTQPKRARVIPEPTALVAIGNTQREQRLTSRGSRMVLWLDRNGRISAVARDRPLSATERLKPIVRIPHIDMGHMSSINFASLLQRTALVPRHTANTFLSKAATWLARHLVWNTPERPDPVQGNEFGGSSLTIELLDEDPSSLLSSTDAADDDVDIGGRGTPGSPVTLLGNASSSQALGDGIDQFVGMDFAGLSGAASAGGTRHAALFSLPTAQQPGGRRLEHAIATRDDPLHEADTDGDIVLGVEIAAEDLPVLARALRRQFPGGSAQTASTASSSSTVGTQPCSGQTLHGATAPITLPHTAYGFGAAAVRLPPARPEASLDAGVGAACALPTLPMVGTAEVDSDGDADL